MSLSIDPLFLILSSEVLTNCLSAFILYKSVTRVLVSTKSYAQVDLSSTIGVPEYTVYLATGSDLLFTLKAGKDERQLFLSKVKVVVLACWVERSKYF